MKTITFRLDDMHAQRYAAIYGNYSAGATFAAYGYIAIRQAELKQLKGYLSASEWACLFEVLKKYQFKPEMMANTPHFIMQIEDGIKYSSIKEALNIDVSLLTDKLAKLNPAGIYFIQDAIREIHEQGNIAVGDFIDEMRA